MPGNMPPGNLLGAPSVTIEEAASDKNAVGQATHSDKAKYANKYKVEESIYGFVVIPTLKGGSSVLLLLSFYVTVITISTIITMSVVEEYNETSDALDKLCDLDGDKYDCRPSGYSKFADFGQLDTDDDGVWSLIEARDAGLLQQYWGLHDVIKQTPELLAIVAPPRDSVVDDFCFIYFGNQETISDMNKEEKLELAKSSKRYSESMRQECSAAEEEGCLLKKLCPQGGATLEFNYRSSSMVYMTVTTSSAVFPKPMYTAMMANMLPVCRLVEPNLCGNAQIMGVLKRVPMWESLDPEQKVSACMSFVQEKCPIAFGNQYSLHQRGVDEVCGRQTFEQLAVPVSQQQSVSQSSSCVDNDAERARLFADISSTSEALSYVISQAESRSDFQFDTLTCATGEKELNLCSQRSTVVDPDNTDAYILIANLFGRACPGTCCRQGSIGCPTICHLERRKNGGTETPFGRVSCMGGGCGKYEAKMNDKSGVLTIQLQRLSGEDAFNLAIESDVALRLQFQKMVTVATNDPKCSRASLGINGVKYCSSNVEAGSGSSDTVILPHNAVGTSIQWRSNVDGCYNEKSDDNHACSITAVLMDAGRPDIHYVNQLGWSEVNTFEQINSARYKIFFFVVLYLWSAYVFIEISTSKHFMRFVLFCPSFPGSRLRRACTFLGVCVPRVLIAWWILAVGYILLRSTPEFMDLVFNNAALAFALEFDEVLFSLAVPKKIKSQMVAMETFTWGAASCDPEHKFARAWVLVKALLPLVFVSAWALFQFSSDFQGLASIHNQMQCSCLLTGSLCTDAVLDNS